MAKGRTIEVKSLNYNSGISAPTMVAFDHTLGKVFYLTEDGKIVYGSKPADQKTFNFCLDQRIELPDNQGIQWGAKFVVYDDDRDVPGGDREKILIERNKGYKKLEEFLKKHPDVSFRDANGKELNSNCVRALFVIVDEDGKSRELIKKTQASTAAKAIITKAYSENQEEFNEYVYGMGLGTMLSLKSPATVCEFLLRLVDENPNPFLDFHESPEREMTAILRKATTSLNGNPPDIEVMDELYTLNGAIIAKGFQELKAYFKANPEQMKYFYDKYGKKKVASKSSAKSQDKED